MTHKRRYLSLTVALLLIAGLQSLLLGESPRLSLKADRGWKFQLGEQQGAEAPAYGDQSWRTVNLPHDWSIESKPSKDNPTGAGGGFFPAGVGWYRKDLSSAHELEGTEGQRGI